MRWKRRILLCLSSMMFAGIFLAGCSRPQTDMVKMVPLDQMPAEVQAAPVTVQEAYRFAVANPDIMKQIPCYCGCGAVGHQSNYECYVAGLKPDGTPIFASHALG